MPHRYSMKQLNEWSNKDLLLMVIRDRTETLTNIYSPLYRRLNKLHSWVEKNVTD